MFAEHTIDGVKRNMGGIDPADLFTCVLPALPYSAQDSPFISFGKEVLNSAALVISVQKIHDC